LVGQEYELEHKLEGAQVGNTNAAKRLDHSDQVVSSGDTRNRLAKEHNISPAAVQRSADLYNSVKTIRENSDGEGGERESNKKA